MVSRLEKKKQKKENLAPVNLNLISVRSELDRIDIQVEIYRGPWPQDSFT